MVRWVGRYRMFKIVASNKTIAARRTGPKIDRNRSVMGKVAGFTVDFVDMFASRSRHKTLAVLSRLRAKRGAFGTH